MDAARADALPRLLDDALAPEATLRSLLLALMSRLLTTRGLAARADGPNRYRIEHVRGPLGLAAGDRFACDATDCLEGEAIPEALRDAGATLVLPLRHGDAAIGLIALGAKATGAAYAPSEVALAQSLANAAAASIRAAETARDLADTGRRLAGRAHELRTLFELSQALGQTLDREAILARLGFALMGQLLVPRCAIALREPDGSLDVAWVRGAPPPVVPDALTALDAPARIEHLEGWRWAVPLRAGEATRGVALLGARADGSALEADFAASLAALAVGALETADRVAERIERERTEEEMRLARRMQRGLLPTTLPHVPGLDLAVRWQPSRSVSGDTYEVCPLVGTDGEPDGRLLVAVADVVGKGIGASLLMATLQAAFRLLRPALEQGNLDLADATRRLDRLVAESTEAHQFVTLAWGIVDVARRRVRTVVAGHPPPRLVRASGAVESLQTGGPLLGVLPDAHFETGEAVIAPGDLLVLYTDGVTEASDTEGNEFEVSGLDAALQAAPRDAPDRTLDAIVDAVARFADGPAESDDLTLVAVRMTGTTDGGPETTDRPFSP